ncbi:epimerase [Devosia soli]|uniref:Epimerase n=1 Tax=Devosia soli TaxID=361041 RepID=A0A0F5LI73_9HYPH|nr:epimerase [Devosia soli]
MERVFITGAAGYVGRNLARHFLENGVAVVAMVRSETSAERLKQLGAEIFVGDILHAEMAGAMSGCDGLVHAAADTDHGVATARQTAINVEGTRRVIAAARQASVRRVVHLSSDSVLADGSPLINVDETIPMPRRPAGHYSRTKAQAETIALSAATSDFAVIALRPRMVWGRDDTTGLRMLVDMAQLGKLAWIGGGTYLTSTTHIANLCHAVEYALRRGTSAEVYFVSDGAPVQFRAFVSALLETQGIAPPTKTVPRAIIRTMAVTGELLHTATAGRIAPPLTLQAFAASAIENTVNIRKAERDLAYRPIVSREEGLAELRALTFRGQ